MTPRSRVAAVMMGLLALATFCALRFEATTDITSFLDAPGSAERGALSRRLSRSEATRTMVLSVGAQEIETALPVAEALAKRMADGPGVVWAAAGPSPDLPAILESVYFEHRYQMLSEEPERELPVRFSDEGLADSAAELKRALGGPLAPLGRSFYFLNYV